jgi:hypothetical protein
MIWPQSLLAVTASIVAAATLKMQCKHKNLPCMTKDKKKPAPCPSPVGPLAQKLSAAPILRMRLGCTPTTSLHRASASSSSSYTLTHTRSGGRPYTRVDSSHAQQMACIGNTPGGMQCSSSLKRVVL